MPKVGRFANAEAERTYQGIYEALAAQWPVPFTDLEIETSFGTTRVRKSGEGAGLPLLLLPGMFGNVLFWQPFIAELARDRVVYASDVIGWPGLSTQTAPVRDEADIAQWVVEVIDGLGVDRVHLAGYSAGAWLSSVVAVHNSDRLASVSLLEPAPATFATPPWRVLLKFLAAGMRPTRAKMEKFNQWLQPGIHSTDQEWDLILASVKFRPGMPWARPVGAERFAAIAAPMLVLFGAETVVHDAGGVAGLVRRLIPSADVEIYSGAGHDMLWALPERVISRLLDFAAAHDHVLS
ncbi:alpha/beta fold hydrolase [Nocardia sp. SYP-A9097]|uniref:alpha/beta fold hydrolase n=1 Tax=Nocardia sp. SYP-A9097 TaxID=2663237 RepID=UPI00132546D7|nr:alpha/beta hydrolase [Nocardia sp. SYP-A9097]MRH93074.1 alpha/beta fold hydrolase [Nocardia sp. SYP-A9097]